jgi:hypothetical protein
MYPSSYGSKGQSTNKTYKNKHTKKRKRKLNGRGLLLFFFVWVASYKKLL